jgi:hypothetical protein
VEHQPQWLELEDEGLTLTLEPFSGKLFTLQRGADYVVTLDDDQPDAIEGVDEILPQPEEPQEEPEAAPEGQEIAAAVEEDEEVLAQAVREHNKWFRSLPREEQEVLFLRSARGRNNYGEETEETLVKVVKKRIVWEDEVVFTQGGSGSVKGRIGSIAAAIEDDEEALAQAIREHNKWFRSLPREEQERLFLKSARGRNNYGKQGKDTEDKPETEAEK